MRLLLHIGFEKTGSTSIQNWFKINRKLLNRSGILYPSSGCHVNHWALLPLAQRDDKEDYLKWSKNLTDELTLKTFRVSFIKALREEVRASECKMVVMSLEQLSSRLSFCEIETLKNYLTEIFDDIMVWAYLRPQCEATIGMWQTLVRSGFQSNPFNFPLKKSLEIKPFYFDQVLELWARVFGVDNIYIRKFEKNQLIDGDVIEDVKYFLGHLGASFESEEYASIQKLNTSLDFLSLEAIRRLNFYIGGHSTSAGPNKKRRGLRRSFDLIDQEGKLSIRRKTCLRYMKNFQKSNEYLFNHFNVIGSKTTFSCDHRACQDFFKRRISDELIIKKCAEIISLLT